MKIMNIIKILGILFLIFILYVLFQLFMYRKIQEENLSDMNSYSYMENCRKDGNYMDNKRIKKIRNGKFCDFIMNDPNCCYCKMRTLLMPRLLVYKVKHNKKPLKFIKPENFAILIPSAVLEESDAFISYGIWKRLVFEENLSHFYNKKIYAYDCGVDKVNTDNPNIIFESECIGTDKFIFYQHEQKSSEKIHSFGQKLKKLNLLDKKLYVKVDIAGAETEVMPDILKYSDNIIGLTVYIDLINADRIAKEIEMLKLIEKDFVLVSRIQEANGIYFKNNCKYTDKRLIQAYVLSYINKNMIDSKYLPFKQDYSDSKDYILLYPDTNGIMIKYKSNWVVILYEKLKNLYRVIKGIKE